MRTWRHLIGLLLAAASPLSSHAAERESVAVAAASDLVFCLEELNSDFQKTHPGVDIQVTTGSSGNFYAQIQRGAPFDVFLSADIEYPRKLVAAGKAVGESLTTYAFGHIVLWSVRPELDVRAGLQVLTAPAVRKVTIANPEHAPYGRAARAALEKAGLWDAVKPKIVLGENISQAAQFVQTGNADVGIVARSLVSAPKLAGHGTTFELPAGAHPPLEQAAVLTRRGTASRAAKAYLAFLSSPEARAVFGRYGFLLPRKE